MKKIYLYYIFCFVFISLFVVFIGGIDNIYENSIKSLATTSNTGSTYTRKQLQNYVVSTALSYENNKGYSDYEQKTMDEGSSNYSLDSRFNWRTFNVSPEMVNRTNYFAIDCSSFATSVYLYSLGFDFSDYYSLSGSVYANNFIRKSAKSSLSNFREAYSKSGKGINTEFFANIGKNKVGKDDVVVYHYQVTGSESSDKKTSIKNKIKSTLQPGDLLIYRTYLTSSDKMSGHVMVYVGDTIDSDLGFIHATGNDYKFDTNPITIGDDDFSVRYDTYSSRMKKIFPSSSTRKTKSITILRPINKFCDGDSCSISVASKDSLEFNKLSINAKARNDVSRLRVEQYVSNVKVTTNGSIGKVTTNSKGLSKYNSVNKGDVLEYKLYLNNRSQFEFCAGDAVNNTSSECKNAGYTWKKTPDGKKKTYSNMKITSKIPDNTTYVSNSCNYNCSYDSSTRTITWNVASLAAGNYRTYSYKVTVGNTSKVVNEGMKLITPNKYTLQLSDIVTNVNPTFNKADLEVLHSNITKFKNLVSNKKIKFDSSSSTGYNVNLDSLKSENISQLGFIKSMYYNTFGIDLSYLTKSNVLNAIFDKKGAKDYAKKTASEVASLTNNNYKNLNKMLVNGFYGGTHLRGNDAGDRPGMLRVSDLEVGDILLTYYTSSGNVAASLSSYLYLGTDADSNHYFARFTSDKGIVLYSKATSSLSSGYRIFKEMYSKDLFLVLRPLKVYGTTIKYNYNGGSGPYSNYVAYSKYRNLVSNPTKANQTLTLEYNKNVDSSYKKSFTASYTFDGWYSDSALTKKVTNSSSLASTTYHTLYAKWKSSAITLPNPKLSGYSVEGWYSDKSLTKKVANAGASYSISKTMTLYAKWTANSYQVKYNANGGTGAMSNSVHTYDKASNLKENVFTKSGYVFNGWSTTKDGAVKYTDKASVKNLTDGTGVVNLYAVWKESEKYTVEVKVVNGSVSFSSKKVVMGSSASFEITNNVGFDTGSVSCTNNQKGILSGTKLTVSNVTKNTVCTVAFAANKYQIKYNANGGTGSMSLDTHIYNQSKKLIKNTFTKIGYSFKGWSLSTGGNVVYSDNEEVKNLTTGTSTINLYAIWSANKYKVIYNSNGGTGTMTDSSFTYDKASNLRENSFKKSGYVFDGWSTTKDGKVIYLDNQSVKNLSDGSNDVVLYAVWRQVLESDFEISIKVENGSSSPKTKYVSKGNNATFIITNNVGYGSGSVSCTNNQKAILSGRSLQVNNVSSDSVCTIKFVANNYQVKYNANGGTGSMSNSSFTYNKEGKLLKNTYTKKGYKFKGWSLKLGNDFDYIDESTVKNLSTNTGIVNLYAVWEKILYSISYDLDGGVLNNKITEYDIEHNDIKLSIPTKSGYEFTGWTGSNGSSLQKDVVITKGTTGDLEYKANWKERKYKIVYASDMNGSITGILNENVSYGKSPSGTEKKVKEGYKDLKWAVNKNVMLSDKKTVIKKGSPITESQIKEIFVEDDLVITAYHYKIKNVVNYGSYDNGTINGIKSEEVASDGSILGTEVKANDGYVFSHWICDKDVTLKSGVVILANAKISNSDMSKIIVKEDLQFKAVFVPVIYKVIYQSDSNGIVNGIKNENKNYHQNPSGTSVISNNGYVLSYWVANQDVVLENDIVIKKNSMILNDELLKIKIDNNVTFTAINSKEELKVFYKTSGELKIDGEEVEIVDHGLSPKGVKVINEDKDKKVVWIADSDIVLKDNTKISIGKEISDDQVKDIVVKENIVLTAKLVDINKTIDKEVVKNNISIFVIVGLILFGIFMFVLFLLRRRKRNKDEE